MDISSLESVRAFPYEEWRGVIRELGESFDAFIPDVDLYTYNLYSYSNGIRRLLEKPNFDKAKVRRELSQTFFEKHPHYKRAENRISAESTPELFHLLDRAEKMRKILMLLLAED